MTKVLVSFDEGLLRRIDRAARAGSKSRSAYLAELAEGAIDRRAGPGRSSVSRNAFRRIDAIGAGRPGDSTAAVRSARDAR
ncbi:MAG: hypothetical protein ACSLFD_01105 [Solirubrobacterales bacterium]